MSERQDITLPILKALAKCGICAMRCNSGKVKAHGGWIKLAPAGTADIVVYPRDRRPVWIETKTESGKLSPKQQEFAERMLDLGHSYWTIRSLDELMQLIEGLR